MKTLLTLAITLSATFLLSSCQKETASEQPQPQTQHAVNNGRCPDCKFISCTNRLHDICPTCGVSRRPPGGCICPPPDPTIPPTPEVPYGTLTTDPNPITIVPGQTLTVRPVRMSMGGWVAEPIIGQHCGITGEAVNYLDMTASGRQIILSVKAGVSVTRAITGSLNYLPPLEDSFSSPIVIQPQ